MNKYWFTNSNYKVYVAGPRPYAARVLAGLHNERMLPGLPALFYLPVCEWKYGLQQQQGGMPRR